MRLAANLRHLRKQRSWSQEEAAHQSEMATPVYQRLEAGSTNATFVTIARLCEGFGVDVRRLLSPSTAPLKRKLPRLDRR